MVKLKITTKWSLKRLKLGMVSSFHPQCTCKRVEVYGKNWTHFMYKLDTPFRGIRVSDENSSVTKGTSFFRTYYNSRLFVRSLRSIQSHVVNFQFFVPSFAIFHAFTDFLSKMTLKLKSTTNELWKGWKFAWCHHFTHIACAKKLREGYGKNWIYFV